MNKQLRGKLYSILQRYRSELLDDMEDAATEDYAERQWELAEEIDQVCLDMYREEDDGGALSLNDGGDYELNTDYGSVWILYRNRAVNIFEEFGSLVINVFPSDEETDVLASIGVGFDDEADLE